MSPGVKKGLAIGGGVAVLAVAMFFLLGNRDGESPIDKINPFNEEPVVCPMTGLEPSKESLVDRPAVAVKIENNSVAYPLSGLADAEIVYEELVEGGLTRFLTMFHCTDAAQAGPVRSSREIDPSIMVPATRILAAAGGNATVRSTLEEAGIFLLDENDSGEAMSRIPREGISSEHTLYADTKALRKLGSKEHDDPPPDDLFRFGELEGKARKATTISLSFSAASDISFEWNGDGWARSDGGAPLVDDQGNQIVVDNVVIEEHTYNYSAVSDVIGTPSVIIEDVEGSGRALLFRDGKVIRGRWEREDVESAVRFVTRDGEEMVFAPGTTWIELVPSDKGEAKGSFDFAR